MIWIEMSRDEIHGGGEWGFKKCLWSPTHKRGKRKASWLFYDNILQVRQGDIIIHLRGEGHHAAFIGYSVAATDGHETLERPPQPGIWDYSASYFRALLKDFQPFDEAIMLDDFFASHHDKLIGYLQSLLDTPVNRFFTYQSNRLQCLNGAYLSKCDEKLLSLIFDTHVFDSTLFSASGYTSEVLRQVKQRIGQSQFSKAVKKNYGYKCCFPDCKVADFRFLVGSHIARWVDNPDKRGNISNGLCFCPIHDKAFELGYFSLDDGLCVLLSPDPEVQTSDVFLRYIKPYAHRKISQAQIPPDKDSLKEHRFRCKIIDTETES